MPQTLILGVACEHLVLATFGPSNSWPAAMLGSDSLVSTMAWLLPALAMLVQPEHCFVSLVENTIRAMPVSDMDVGQLGT